jgi:hypothetical protein
MRIYTSPIVVIRPKQLTSVAPACLIGNVFASAKFPTTYALLPHPGLADAITPAQIFSDADAAKLLRGHRGDGNCGTVTPLRTNEVVLN